VNELKYIRLIFNVKHEEKKSYIMGHTNVPTLFA